MMGLNAAVQALKKAEKLKEKVVCSNDLLNNKEAWIWQQQLQTIYQQVLLLDLEYALDQKVEQELWNHGFKTYIGLLQDLVKDRKNPKRSESQALLTWCLESASGFYLTLLQEICSTFDLDLSFRRNGSVYGSNEGHRLSVKGPVQPHKNSCSYICQHCLVHLGDIARYRNQNRQAEAFYRHAVQVSPTSGQPYNQLALLDSSRGDRLGTVFHYVRSVAVRHLFPAASTNLTRMLSKCAQEQISLDGRSRLSAQECVTLFLKLHGILHLESSDLTTCTSAIRLFTDTLTAQVATESFTSRKLTQMLVINLFALHHGRGGFLGPEGDRAIRADETLIRTLVLDLVAGSLCSLLLPVYTLRDGDTLLDYFALPTIKLTLDWIRMEPRALAEPAFQSRPQMWPSLCRLLNGLQPALALFTGAATHYATVPLPEDRELQGFLPLEGAMSGLRFGCEDTKIESPHLNRLRASRLLQFGEWLARKDELGFITSREEPDGTLVFEAASSSQAPSSELLRELEQLSLGPKQSPSPSDLSSGSGSGSVTASTPDHLIGPASPSPQPQTELPDPTLHTTEKRAGILKPQGSLEKAREKEAIESSNVSVLSSGAAGRKTRQNVAMQAIMRKGTGASSRSSDADTKQVSFKTPSPPTPTPTPTPTPAPMLMPTSNDKRPGWSMTRPLAQRPRPRALPTSPSSSSSPTPFSVPPEAHMLRPPFGPWLDEAQKQIPTAEHNGPLSGGFHIPQGGAHNGSLGGPNPPPGGSLAGHLRPPDNCMALPVHINAAENCRTWWPTNLDQDPNQSQGFAPPVINMFVEQNGALGGKPTAHEKQQMRHQGPVNHWGPVNQPHPQQNQEPFHSLLFQQQQQQSQQQSQQRQQNDAFPPAETFSPYSLFSANSWLAPALTSGSTPGAQTAQTAPSVQHRNDAAAVVAVAAAVAAATADDDRTAMSHGNERAPTDSSGGIASAAPLVASQSLWSGPGPSPLERLLEQQKLLREGPAPKGGT